MRAIILKIAQNAIVLTCRLAWPSSFLSTNLPSQSTYYNSSIALQFTSATIDAKRQMMKAQTNCEIRRNPSHFIKTHEDIPPKF